MSPDPILIVDDDPGVRGYGSQTRRRRGQQMVTSQARTLLIDIVRSRRGARVQRTTNQR